MDRRSARRYDDIPVNLSMQHCGQLFKCRARALFAHCTEIPFSHDNVLDAIMAIRARELHRALITIERWFCIGKRLPAKYLPTCFLL
jgi:hypothetical protein